MTCSLPFNASFDLTTEEKGRNDVTPQQADKIIKQEMMDSDTEDQLTEQPT